jgi:hypothetical protein
MKPMTAKELRAVGKTLPRVTAEQRKREYFCGTADDFALVQDADGKPVERDDPRNAELKNSGPKKRTKK